MELRIDRDTKLCISLAAQPGTFGNKFHNYLFNKMDIPMIYKSMYTLDLQAAINGIRALNIRGCGLSMPFKIVACQFVDELSDVAKEIGAINTIVNNNSKLVGFNTDYLGFLDQLRKLSIPRELKTLIVGSGGMARAVVYALKQYGITDCTIVSRNQESSISLAQQYRIRQRNTKSHKMDKVYEFLINTTPIGMQGKTTEQRSVFSVDQIKHCKVVCDVVNNSASSTQLINTAVQFGKLAIEGKEIAKLQAVEQFKLYTHAAPTDVEINEAYCFAVDL